MSDTDVTVKLPKGAFDAGRTTVSDYLRGDEEIRAYHSPAKVSTYGDQGQYSQHIAETVTLRVGLTSVTLSPEVWRAAVGALTEVLDAAEQAVSV